MVVIREIMKSKWFKPVAFIFATLAVVIVPIAAYRPPTNTLVLDGQKYTLQIVVSSQDRQKGLGGREELAANEGMLFIQPKAEIACFWMKDMKFDIDIIWLDGTKIVRHIEERLSPKTYPKSYCPKTPAKYVVELPSGSVDKHELVIGQKLPLK